ncbi:MAG: hypothetical protein WD294_11205 [Phycisphaeraceae bacterium]
MSTKARDAWVSVLMTLSLLASLALFGLGGYLALVNQEFVLLGLGLIAVVVSAAGLAFAAPAEDGSAELVQAVQRQHELLESINNRLLISDKAKRVAFRQKDRETLREAIVEDVRREDYDAAMILVDEMADSYGYREEAEQFRDQILQAQEKKREQFIKEAIIRIDQMCNDGDWDDARQHAHRLVRLYHGHPGVNGLPERVAEAKEKRKADLEREFLRASEREDVERAMELLKELDGYLTSEEAAPYMETARGVVGKKRENLGVRFKIAVQDRDWLDALNVGEQIVREFPNSKFAHEVRSMIDTLRERAAHQRAAMAEESL